MQPSSIALLSLAFTVNFATAITWDGSASANWSATANWDLNRVPNVSDPIIFPAAGANKVVNNDRPTVANGHAILTFSGSGYTRGGLALNLIDASAAIAIVEATHATGTALVTVSGAGLVRFDAPQSMDSTQVTGELILTSTMTGDLLLLDPGILRGTGTISGNVSVSGETSSQGTPRPGGSRSMVTLLSPQVLARMRCFSIW